MKYYASIQNVDNVLKRKPVYQNIKEWVIQEKIEGMNMSIVIDPSRGHLPELTAEFKPNPYYKKLDLRGRTDRTDYDFSKVSLPSFDEMVSFFNIKEGSKVVLFGELCGGGIQKEWYYEEPTFVLFDIKHETPHHEFFMDAESVPVIAEGLGLKGVPILGTTTEFIDTESFLSMWITDSHLNPKVKAEGIVAKPTIELNDKFGERVIYKTRFANFK